MRPSVELRDEFRIDLASRLEQFVVADIRAFFHSIYTHAIPWAIYGKVWAKENRSFNHFGNLLDLLCRNSQDGQTIGLPVGPDTSRLIAEVIASAVDLELKRRIKLHGRDASRYVDDYTIGVSDVYSGESLISALRQSAAMFELELNNDKSSIQPTSFRHNSGWKQAVLAYVPRTEFTKDKFRRFFYEVDRVCYEQSEINVEKYAFQNARSAFVHAEDWKYVQSQLISTYRRNSSLVSFLVEVVILREVEHSDIDKNLIKEFIEHRLVTLANENRTGEIIWFLFLAIRLELQLSAKPLKPLYDISNAFIAVLITYADDRGFISGDVNYETWDGCLNEAGLSGPMWLYAYEVVRHNLRPIESADFVSQNAFFKPLLAKRVSFLSIENGFASISSTLRERRGENARLNWLLNDFVEDFQIDTDEFEDDFDDEFEEEDEVY